MESGDSAERLIIRVDGMTCSGCTGRLTRVLERAAGVEDVLVTLEPGQAIINGPVERSEICSLIFGAGFEVLEE